MRKQHLILFLLFLITKLSAQTNTFPATGNVGIGTLSPTERFHVVGGKIFSNGLGTSSGFALNNWSLYQDSTGVLRLMNNTSERLRFSSPGDAFFLNNVNALSFIRSGGLSTQFLKADGSIDSTKYAILNGGIANYIPRFSNTNTLVPGLIIDNGSGVGIGSSPLTSSLFTVYKATTSSSGNVDALYSSLGINPSATQTAGTFSSGRFETSVSSSSVNDISLIRTLNVFGSNFGTGTISNQQGANFQIEHNSSGIINSQVQLRVRNGIGNNAGVPATGTIKKAVGLQVATAANAAGTIQDVYGIEINDLASGNVTGNRYGIFQGTSVNSLERNVFWGNTSIGSKNNNGYKLDVNGNSLFAGNLTVANGSITTKNLVASDTISGKYLMVPNGQASQFLKADGSLDTSVYLKNITDQHISTALGYIPVNPDTLGSNAFSSIAFIPQNEGVKYTDTSLMLSQYALRSQIVQQSDLSAVLSSYLTTLSATETYAPLSQVQQKLNVIDTAAMLSGYALRGQTVLQSDLSGALSSYLTASSAASLYATLSQVQQKLNVVDTAAMLSGYALRGQTVQQSDLSGALSSYLTASSAASLYATLSQVQQKLNVVDTAAMLSGYALRGQTVQQSDLSGALSSYLTASSAASLYATQSQVQQKLNVADTATMLSGYALRGQTVQQSDLSGALSSYLTASSAASLYATLSQVQQKLNVVDTAAMLSGYALRGQTVQQSDLSGALSSYLTASSAASLYATQSQVQQKLNVVDTAAMLGGYLKMVSNSSPVMGGATLNGVLNGTQATFTNSVYLAKNGGAVVIGNANPATHKLAVDGSIAARKVVVNTPENWADYVFADDYSLRSLDDVKAFIKQYKHLPDVPSEREVKQKGIDLADMQAVLLKKIEELTLYVLSLESKVKRLEKKDTIKK